MSIRELHPISSNFCPLVSIITPTYNHESFIGSCVESVLAQSYSHWEQIIVDDGSSDHTGKILAGYDDARIRYVHKCNQGPFELAKNYNHGLSRAKGELVAILEGDDFWPPDKLMIQVPAFINSDIVLAYGEVADVDSDGQEQRRTSWTTRVRKGLPTSVLLNEPIGSATRHMLTAEGRSLVCPSAVIIRRSALEQIGGFQYIPNLPLTDYPTFMELSLLGNFRYSEQTMGYRRRHEKSITVNHAQTIHDTVSSFTLDFLGRHHDKIALSSSELRVIEESWLEAEDKLHFSEGRLLLLQQRWSEARSHFRTAVRSERLSVRLAAMAGVLCSWLHSDIERLMRLGGIAELRSVQSGSGLSH
jgi:glycosyltransferase involved in cell wall biosynthesis